MKETYKIGIIAGNFDVIHPLLKQYKNENQNEQRLEKSR